LPPIASGPIGTLAIGNHGEGKMKIEKIHHVAYRCNDARETIEFYERVLNMKLLGAVAEDHVPSTKVEAPYMHVFLDAGNGNILAFFELPTFPPMGHDPATPDWVQHIAFQVASIDELMEAKDRAESAGLEVVGVTDHNIFKSIYFFDPNGHRLEVAAWTTTPEKMQNLADAAWPMIEEWSQTKVPPRHNAWIHAEEFAGSP